MNIQLPDNSVVQFPDGMPMDQVNAAITQHLGEQQPVGNNLPNGPDIAPAQINQAGNPAVTPAPNNNVNQEQDSLSQYPQIAKDLPWLKADPTAIHPSMIEDTLKPLGRGIAQLSQDIMGKGQAPGSNLNPDELGAVAAFSPTIGGGNALADALEGTAKNTPAASRSLANALSQENPAGVLEDRMANSIFTPKAAPMSGDDIKEVANAHFAHADELGAYLAPTQAQQLRSTIAGPAPTTPTQLILQQKSPVTKFLSEFDNSFNGPLTLSDAEGMYRYLGDQIDSVGLKNDGSYNSDGVALRNAQMQIRSFLKNSITPGDIAGGAAGYEAWSNGQKAWMQAMKAHDLERIQARANLSSNPTTAYQTGVRNLLLNNKKIGVYSPDEVAALQSSMKTGIGQDALNVFGSKLLPLGASMVGEATGGPLMAAALGGVAHVGSTLSRSAAASIKANQFANAIGQVSSNVPAVSDAAAQAYARLLQARGQ